MRHWLRQIRLLTVLAGIILPSCVAVSQAALQGPASEDVQDRQAIASSIRDLCDRELVLLGENGYHGDGRTVAFKVALIQELVRRCDFNAVFFEASHYDFLEISRRIDAGEEASAEMVSSAIGWLWNRDQELRPLIPFLLAQARAGRVALGGLDDQLGSMGMFYSLERMPEELAGLIEVESRDACREQLRQRIWSDYPSHAPYSESIRSGIHRCLSLIKSAAVELGSRDGARRDHYLQLVSNIERALERDFLVHDLRVWERDRSMFLNLQWLADRVPAPSKIIIWASNTHVARDASASPQFAGGRNLGSYVHESYGERAFAMGFTAASGSFRFGNEVREIPPAPPGSLETLAVSGNNDDTIYLDSLRLARMGSVVGAVFDGHQYLLARWASIYDGVIVFPVERPPRRALD